MKKEIDTSLPIRNITDLKANSAVDAVTGCWIWKGQIDGGIAVVKVVLAGKRQKIRGRAAVTILASGKPVPKGFQARRNRDCCENMLCVSPSHVTLVQVNAPPELKPVRMRPLSTISLQDRKHDLRHASLLSAAKWPAEMASLIAAHSSVFGFAESMR